MARFDDFNPAILERQSAFLETLMHDVSLPRRLQELLRLRIAFQNQCRTCMAMRYEDAIRDGVTEEVVCMLERPEDAAGLSEGDRLALRFAELFATNHLAIDGALIDQLHEHFTARQVYEIGVSCAAFVGFGRFAAVRGSTAGLPPEFLGEHNDPLTPWGVSEVIIHS